MEIKWTNTALNDLNNFKTITQKNNPSNYINNLYNKVSNLKNFPSLGKIYLYTRKKIIRQLIHEEHTILYYIQDETIIILAVVHHKQDISKKISFIKNFIN